MPKFPDTEEQVLILNEVKSSKRNLLIQALAGAAKTSTLVRIAETVRGIPILSIAFNKRIADEMAERLPSHCSARTLNSIGHRAWAEYTGKRLSVDSNKIGDILRGIATTPTEKEIISEIFPDICRLASRAKLAGYIPEGKYAEGIRLCDKETLFELFADDEYPEEAWAYLDEIIFESIRQAFEGRIDYDDQLYMPTLFRASFPRFPLTLVDEAQDLSPLNHYMIERLVDKRRLIAVGDQFQSIYAFRGALSDSMNMLRTRFDMKELNLTVSFRCPKRIVERARSRASLMKYAPTAIDGEILDLAHDEVLWSPKLLPQGAAVICRNNAPLFSLGLKLIAAGIPVTVRGMEISKRLIKILREFGDTSMPQEELLGHLNNWRRAKLAEGKLKAGTVEDRYECLCVFARATATLGQAIAHAERLFASTGKIELLSGHKSKGLEWDEVFHLDPWRIPSKYAKEAGGEALSQELNLEYVITTRAKRKLVLINIDGFDPSLDEPYHLVETSDANR